MKTFKHLLLTTLGKTIIYFPLILILHHCIMITCTSSPTSSGQIIGTLEMEKMIKSKYFLDWQERITEVLREIKYIEKESILYELSEWVSLAFSSSFITSFKLYLIEFSLLLFYS